MILDDYYYCIREYQQIVAIIHLGTIVLQGLIKIKILVFVFFKNQI